MSNIAKRVLLVFALLMVIFKPIQVDAEIVEQDDLKVKLQLENVEEAQDEVKATLSLTNIGIRTIDKVNIENILPEGMNIKDKNNLMKEVGEINAGETVTYEFYYKVDNEDAGTNKPEIDNEDAGTNKPEIDNEDAGTNKPEIDNEDAGTNKPEIDNEDAGTNKPEIDNEDAGTNKPEIDNEDVGTNEPEIDNEDVGTNEPEMNGDENTTQDETLNNNDKVDAGDNNIILKLIIIIIICGFLILLLSNKKFRSLFICISLLTSVLKDTIIIIEANEYDNNEIYVKEEITIDDKLYTFETIVKYEEASNEVVPFGQMVTRGEWIKNLIEILDLKNQQEIEWDDEIEYPFSDVEGTQYEEDVLYAYVNNILVDEGDTFNPDAFATREFATVTAIKALGFVGDQDIECEDASNITYLKEIEVAISLGLINLEENNFYPLRGLTESEAHYLTEGIKGILKSSEIDENYDSTFEYREGVIELDDDVMYEINGTIITFDISEIVSDLKIGDIIVLPNQSPYKVTGVAINADNVIVETEEPTLEETLEYIDIQGYATGNLSEFIPAEGVTVMEGSTPYLDVELGKESITLKVEDGPLEGTVEITIPKAEYKADIDIDGFNTKVHDAYLKLLFESEVTGSLSLFDYEGEHETSWQNKMIELGSIPLYGIPGVGILADVFLGYDASGSAKVVYSLEGTAGVQILDNNLRAIKTFNQDLTFPTIEASVKIGAKINALLEIFGYWNVIDFSVFGGPAASGTLTRHPNLDCLDATIYTFLDLILLDQCKIKEWLNLSWTLELFNADNSPLRANWHFENDNKVSDCTYGEGIIKGSVAEAGNRDKYLKDALIQIYDHSNNTLIKEITSDLNGQYELSLNEGTYRIKISKNGYISFESMETVISGEETYIQTYLMVGQGTDGQVASAGGKITNAVTGGSVPGITINVRPGWNNVLGDPLLTTTTNNEGNYEVILPLGNYTVEMIKEGYVTKHYNIYVLADNALNQHNTIVPNSTEMPAGDLRIVLTWGEKPRDLDSHLVGPTANGNDYFHIYYADKKYSENSIIYADLDLDDTTSYGPETTTVYNMNNAGKYSFYVHDFTNGLEPLSVEMSNSGAKVDVYKGDILYATYHIPTNTEGIYWHVFDFDAAENVIIPVNNFVDGIYNNSTLSLDNDPIEILEIKGRVENE